MENALNTLVAAAIWLGGIGVALLIVGVILSFVPAFQGRTGGLDGPPKWTDALVAVLRNMFRILFSRVAPPFQRVMALGAILLLLAVLCIALSIIPLIATGLGTGSDGATNTPTPEST